MAYRELIKNFENIRSCMREFYVYGFKPRGEYTEKSPRSHDDENRRLKSWLGDYMSFRWGEGGKTVFISVDSRQPESNPLFRAWRSKSFTDCDITLHFIIFDILYESDVKLTCGELLQITEENYLSGFENPMIVDESTLRKKLKEYVAEGLLSSEKQGNKTLYFRAKDPDICLDYSLLSFFSEVAPCGVIGSFLLDRTAEERRVFVFKHHYITQTLDSDVLLALLQGIDERREVEIQLSGGKGSRIAPIKIVPVKIFVSVQNGRQYVMAYTVGFLLQSYRIDRIKNVKLCGGVENYGKYKADFCERRRHMWGTSVRSGKTEHVEFIVRVGAGEKYIYRRLQREKRCGEVHWLGKDRCFFSADVYDSREMVPWIRTFICRIEDIKADNPAVINGLKKDLSALYETYLEGDGDDI